MDVRCESCSSEYEFDEARIPVAGLPVKCSTCGHVFRVYPPGDGLPSAGNTGEWMVRQTNGSVFSFRELTTLQRWIVERKVARDDEISKTGKQWKRLGDIAELATFFQVVEAQVAPGPEPQPMPQHQQGLIPGQVPPQQQPGQMPMPQQQQGLIPGQVPPGTGPQQQMPMPPGSGPQQQMQPPGTGPQQQMQPPGTGPQQQMPVPPGTGPQQQMPTPQGPQGAAWEGADQQLGFNPPSGNWQMHETNPGFTDSTFDDDDDFELKRGGAGKWIVMLLLLLIGGGAGAVYYLRPDLVEKFLGGAVDPAVVAQVETGYKKLARDSYTSLDEAIAIFEKAAKAAPEYVDANAGLAEAELARADYLKEEAEALAASLEAAPEAEKAALEVEIENKRREASQRTKRAFEVGKAALSKAPASLAANRAMADYYRVMNAMDKMQPLVDKARAVAPKDARLECVVGSSLAAEAAEAAINHLEQALATAPELQRARYRLASVHFAAGAKDKSAVHVERLLQEVPDHERAKALKAQLTEPEPEPEPEPVPEAAPKVSFEGLMSQADRMRDSDRPGQALKLYERASDMISDEPDVYLGMGWCYIDLEQPAAAISTFKTALRYAPRLSDAHMGLAEGYRMKGDNANAIKHYEKYLDIMPSGPEAAVARRMLKILKK